MPMVLARVESPAAGARSIITAASPQDGMHHTATYRLVSERCLLFEDLAPTGILMSAELYGIRSSGLGVSRAQALSSAIFTPPPCCLMARYS